jgi:hypothetical protein
MYQYKETYYLQINSERSQCGTHLTQVTTIKHKNQNWKTEREWGERKYLERNDLIDAWRVCNQ